MRKSELISLIRELDNLIGRKDEQIRSLEKLHVMYGDLLPGSTGSPKIEQQIAEVLQQVKEVGAAEREDTNNLMEVRQELYSLTELERRETQDYLKAYANIEQLSANEIRQRDALLATVLDMNIQLNTLQSAEALLERTLRQAMGLMDGHRGLIAIREGEQLQVSCQYGFKDPRDREKVLETTAALLAEPGQDPFQGPKGTRSRLISLLRREGKPVGAIYLEREESGPPFRPVEEEFMKIFASQVSLAFNNSLLFTRIRRQNRELKRMMLLKNTFIEHLSRDLKHPLSDLEQLIAQATSDPEGKNARARQIIGWILRTIDHLLSIPALQKEVGQMYSHTIDLEAMVGEILANLETEIQEKALQVSVNKEPNAQLLEGNKDVLYTILDEVICNAIVYNRQQGTVDISIEEVDDRIQIRVRDSGMGIRNDELEKVFQRFYRSEESYDRFTRGAGLGLYITRSFVETYGGTITIDSEPGQGTTVKIRLPA